MKLLIVDDHPAQLQQLRAQLEADGHDVRDAANGADALHVLERESVEGIISGVVMPRMDGYRLCLEVRKQERFTGLPIVLYTPSYDPFDRELAEAAGADAIIAEPASTSVLLESLRRASSQPRRRASLAAADKMANRVLKQYSESLARKLEAKSLELELSYESLVRTEARLSSIVETAIDAIIAVDEAHRIVLFNAAAARIFQCAREDALDRPLNDFIPARFRERHTIQIEDFAHHGASARHMAARKVFGLRADGSEFPIEASISKLEDENRQLYTVFIRDISDRLRAEQALVQSEAALRRAQELAKVAHLVTGPGGRFESWSETLPKLIGVDADNMPRSGREFMALIHPGDRPLFRSRALEAARHGMSCEVVYRLRRDPQDWVDIRQIMEPLPDAGGGTGGGPRWFNTLQDITEQKRAEARILSLNRVYAVLSGINALIVRAQDRDELFRETCRIAVDDGKFTKAWIGVIEPGYDPVRLVAWHGAEDYFFETLQQRLSKNAAGGVGVLARAISGMQPVVCNDIENDPAVVERKNLVAAGSRSLAIFPFVIDGVTAGVMSLHAPVTGFFDGEEMKLLLELANDIAFAMDHLLKTEQINYLANYDALTGLPNRRLFSERLSQRIEAAADNELIMAVVLLDLERFRRVNDTLGRAAGDDLLKTVAARLKHANATFARIGVDLFVCEILDKHTALEVAHALEQLSNHCFGEPFNLSGEELRIGCRGGIAVFPADGRDAETLLRNAEAALRRAKAAAEHCVFYAPDMNARAAEALALESKLRRAIERQEFVLHYQPKIKFSDGRICGVEALIRWQDPEQGLIPPMRFISVLEEAGLIGAVGQWALGQAMADCRRWRDADLGALRVAVNVSPLQLHQPDFSAQITDAITVDGGGVLELEITESVIMDNVERNVAMLKEIRALGVTIAIDDFGTGYSSLAYIAQLPVTSLKIDRAFVTGMTQGPEGWTMVSSIIALAHALQLKVVAEGVETEEQAQMLRLLSCDEAQGFLFSQPVPAGEIETMLRSGSSLPLPVAGGKLL